MKISIITATFNSSNTIEKTLDSLNILKFKNFEHIIQDNFSSDETISIIKKKGLVNSKIYLEKDNGIFDAINRGIKKSNGDIIGILHSDDYFDNKYVLDKVSNAFAEFNCDVLYGDLNYVQIKNNKIKILRKWRSGNYSKKKIYNGWMPPHPTLFIKKKIFEDIGLYDLNYRISSDYEFILRLFLNDYKIKYIPELITNMLWGGNSNSSIKNLIRKTTEDYKIAKTYLPSPFRCIFLKNLIKIPQFINF